MASLYQDGKAKAEKEIVSWVSQPKKGIPQGASRCNRDGGGLPNLSGQIQNSPKSGAQGIDSGFSSTL